MQPIPARGQACAGAPPPPGGGDKKQPKETDDIAQAGKKVQEAGYDQKKAEQEIKDGKMTDKAGKRFAFEMLLNDASFERIALPYRQNLERIGVDMNVRTVDTAQFKRREDEFDFDMMSDGFGQSLSPGNEQRDFWGSKAAETVGSRNTAGITPYSSWPECHHQSPRSGRKRAK